MLVLFRGIRLTQSLCIRYQQPLVDILILLACVILSRDQLDADKLGHSPPVLTRSTRAVTGRVDLPKCLSSPAGPTAFLL